MFYVPQDPLRTLKTTDDGKEELDYDLCFDCHESLLKWILSVREKKMKEEEKE